MDFQTVGTLILVDKLDFESVNGYNLTIVVSDRGIPQRSSSVPVLITVMDTNDNPPSFSRAEYNVIVNEGAETGREILQLFAVDPDSTLMERFNTQSVLETSLSSFYRSLDWVPSSAEVS